jgi:hypothetical protein
MAVEQSEEELFIAMGTAAIKLWSDLPQEIQHMLFDESRVISWRGDKATSCDVSLCQALADDGCPQGLRSSGARQSGRVGHSSPTHFHLNR